MTRFPWQGGKFAAFEGQTQEVQNEGGDGDGLFGVTRALGNPYDNAKAESLMKTLKMEEVYLMEYDTFEDVVASLLHSALGCRNPAKSEQEHARQMVRFAA